MKITIVTGRLAEDIVKKILEKAEIDNIDVKIEVAPIDVIGSATTEILAKLIRKREGLLRKLREADIIVIPGTVRGDATVLEELTGKTVYKGPREPYMIKEMLQFLSKGGKLAKNSPADEIIGGDKLSKLLEVIRKTVSNQATAFEINGLRIPLRPPPFIVAAETPPRLPPERLGETAEIYEEEGADIIVVGAPSGEPWDDTRRRLREADRVLHRAVLGIDSDSPKTLERALEMGAEIAFSLTYHIIDRLKQYREKAFIVIPYPPANPHRCEALRRTLRKARKAGLEKIIIDPIVNPPGRGLNQSLEAYIDAARAFPEHPILAGLSNITELIDADSVGVNALAVQVMGELGASVLLTTEDSYKTRRSVLETRIASIMTAASLFWRKPPENIGIDLLMLKEKKKPIGLALPWLEKTMRIEVKPDRSPLKLDRWGYVTIHVDYDEKRIYTCVKVYTTGEQACYHSRDPRVLYREVVSRYPFTPQHAAYLGYELSKAEIALHLGKQYVQDEPVIIDPMKRYMEILNEYRRITGMKRND